MQLPKEVVCPYFTGRKTTSIELKGFGGGSDLALEHLKEFIPIGITLWCVAHLPALYGAGNYSCITFIIFWFKPLSSSLVVCLNPSWASYFLCYQLPSTEPCGQVTKFFFQPKALCRHTGIIFGLVLWQENSVQKEWGSEALKHCNTSSLCFLALFFFPRKLLMLWAEI